MAILGRLGRFWSLLALVTTIVWLIAGFYFINERVGLWNLASLSLGELGGIIAGMLAPLALLWVLVQIEGRAQAELRQRALLVGEIEQLMKPATEAAGHAATVTAELRRQAEVLQGTSSDATRAIDATRQIFREQSKALIEAATQLAGAVDNIKDALTAQASDMTGLSQRLADQRTSLAEAARGETAALAETVKGAAAGIASLLKVQA
ncbi:MAG TPA: hypothetical protein VFE11_16630, partial [Dongiaceae bacterium]|nr:hypothetical protein [Dongiaceae bacterium]